MPQIPAIYEEGRQRLEQLLEDYQTDATFVGRLMTEWERAQDRVRAKLAGMTNEELQEIGRYDRLKGKLESAAEVAKIEDFAEFAPQIVAAMEKVEAKREALRLEQEDRDVLKQIKARAVNHLNTVEALDEAEENVRSLSAELHRPESADSDIQKILREIEEKRSRYGRQLEELEDKINKAMTANELNAAERDLLRAEAIFKGSILSKKFDALHAGLNDLRDKAELLATVSGEANKSQTIADCLRAKARGEEVAAQIRGTRFEGQINELISQLESKMERIRQEEEKKAKKKLEGFYRKWKEIETESDIISKIRLGEEFMREFYQHKQTLNQYLPAEHQSDIAELLNAVHSALDSDRETQICALFSRLPEELRIRVYARLGELIAKDHIRLNGQPETQPMVVDHV